MNNTTSAIEPNPAIPQTDWKAECLRLMEKIVIHHRAVCYLAEAGAFTGEQWDAAKARATSHPAPKSQNDQAQQPHGREKTQPEE